MQTNVKSKGWKRSVFNFVMSRGFILSYRNGLASMKILPSQKAQFITGMEMLPDGE